jgi:hypothetical protein
MTPSDDPIAAYLSQASILLGLPIRPEHHDEVVAAFRVLTAQAKLITDFALPDETEPAPRFVLRLIP